MDIIFNIVYRFLEFLSHITGFTYKEINILAYYFIIPLFYFHLIDRLFKVNYFKIAFLAIITITFLIIDSFEQFSEHLFQLSVDFLNWFDVVGLNYVQASVVICVFVPILLYFTLFYFVKKRVVNQHSSFVSNDLN